MSVKFTSRELKKLFRGTTKKSPISKDAMTHKKLGRTAFLTLKRMNTNISENVRKRRYEIPEVNDTFMRRSSIILKENIPNFTLYKAGKLNINCSLPTFL